MLEPKTQKQLRPYPSSTSGDARNENRPLYRQVAACCNASPRSGFTAALAYPVPGGQLSTAWTHRSNRQNSPRAPRPLHQSLSFLPLSPLRVLSSSLSRSFGRQIGHNSDEGGNFGSPILRGSEGHAANSGRFACVRPCIPSVPAGRRGLDGEC